MEGVLKMKELADMLAECSTRLEDLANIAFVSKNEEWKENVNGFALDTWAAAECIAQIFGYAFLHVRHNIVEL